MDFHESSQEQAVLQRKEDYEVGQRKAALALLGVAVKRGSSFEECQNVIGMLGLLDEEDSEEEASGDSEEVQASDPPRCPTCNQVLPDIRENEAG